MHDWEVWQEDFRRSYEDPEREKDNGCGLLFVVVAFLAVMMLFVW